MTDVHPAAAVFPMLPDDELEVLAEDIKANGLLHPIVRTPDGLLLDGRNRLEACTRAGVHPDVVTYEGDPVAFVLGANVTRRHMTTGARAMATAVVLATNGKRRDGKWSYGAVPNVGDSPRSTWQAAMADAGVVLDVTPEAAPSVIVGAVSLHAAHAAAIEARKAAESAEERFARLPSDLAELVREERMSLADAEAALRDRERRAADERRDARALLMRILDLAAPAEPTLDFTEAWAVRMGPLEPDLIVRIHDAVGVLTDLAKRAEHELR